VPPPAGPRKQSTPFANADLLPAKWKSWLGILRAPCGMSWSCRSP